MGIISASVVAGLYKRSFTTGFKTFIYIISCIIGMALGIVGVWIVFRLLHLNISDTASVLTGLLAGLLGGLLIGFTATKLLPPIFKYYKPKF